jgi:methionyl-tRNA formyltransferase
LLHGDNITGVTTFALTEGIDCGGVYLNRGCTIDAEQSAGTLTSKLAQLGAAIISDSIQLALRGVRVVPQYRLESPLLRPSKAPRFAKEFFHTDWCVEASEIVARCRALAPRPALHASVGGIPCKLYHLELTAESAEGYQAGDVVMSRRELKIACLDYFVRCTMLKPTDRDSMSAAAFYCGYHCKCKHFEHI